MPTRTIDLAEAQAALIAVVNEHPYRTNNGRCFYTINGEPHCIIANVLDRLDIDLPDEDNLNLNNDTGFSSQSFQAFLAGNGVVFTDPARQALDIVQLRADAEGEGDVTWMNAARDYMPGVDARA